MKNEFPNYFQTQDGENLFITTNFDIEKEQNRDLLLIFNYGLVCSNGHWEKQIPYFDELGYKILIHDLRGHHNSTGDANYEHCTFENVSNDIKELVDHLKFEKIFMLGHSMGVNITLEYARRFPENLIGMVLISGTVIPPQGVMFNKNIFELFTPIWRWFAESFPETYETIWKTSGSNPLMQIMVHRGGFNPTQVPIEFVQQYLNRVGRLKPEIFFQCFQQMADHDIITVLEDIKTPALIMGGDKDQIIPNYLQEILIQKLPNAQKYVIQDGSHVPQVDFPDTVNERIQLFLERLNYK